MIWIVLAVGVCLLDLKFKNMAETRRKENEIKPIAGGRIVLTRHYNAGAMLGWLQEKPKQLLGITLLGVGVVAGCFFGSLRSREPWLVKMGLALLTGGASSNAYERIFKHRVTDYFRFRTGHKKFDSVVFNLGDMAIFVGALCLVLGELRRK